LPPLRLARRAHFNGAGRIRLKSDAYSDSRAWQL
jgi:hypothetical protein